LGWINGLAIYFIIWWTVLFAILPVGMRSQQDEGEIVLGTEHGAPARFSVPRKVFWTTVASTIVFVLYYAVTQVWGIGMDSFPNFVPDGAQRY
jgi:predicted secreted protein